MDLGGWYPYLNDCEEHSFSFKLQKIMKENEYLMFDPSPMVLRRFDIVGGIGRRNLSFSAILKEHLKYYHWVVAKYFPIKFYGLYLFFIIYTFRFVAKLFRKYSKFDNNFLIKTLGMKYGRKLYIFMELILYPFWVLCYLFGPRPKSNDDMPFKRLI